MNLLVNTFVPFKIGKYFYISEEKYALALFSKNFDWKKICMLIRALSAKRGGTKAKKGSGSQS